MINYKFILKNGFILGLLLVVGLAFLFPQLGAKGGVISSQILTKIGVLIIFFLQGLSLPTKELAHGLTNWRLHVFVQSWNFVFSAFLLLLLGWGMNAFGSEGIGQGFYYLALLPTTISSAVAFTASANGNVSGSIFNTTLSNVIGVFWVPTGAIFIFSSGSDLPAGLVSGLLIKLSGLILLPLIMGQIIRPFVVETAIFNLIKPRFKTINNIIILFIVYVAFCGSILSDTWNRVLSVDLTLLIISSAFAVILIHGLVWTTGKIWLKERSNQIAGLFCGAQKTLAAGVPMASAIFASEAFGGNINMGLILIPLMCYHLMQLFLAGIFIGKLTQET